MQTGSATAAIIQPAVQLGSIQSLSRPTSVWVTMRATVIKNLQVARRYIPNLIGNLAEIAVRAAFFLLMANAVSFRGRETLGLDFTGRDLLDFIGNKSHLLGNPKLW